MSKILTDNQYYSQIANIIREQNETINTYTPPQMVSALKDLFYEEVEGVPPITFQGIGENLLDYRIDGASGGVGDRTSNLYNSNLETNILINALLVEQSSNDYKLSDYIIIPNDGLNISGFINLQSGDAIRFILYDTNKNIIERLFKVSTVVNINNTQGVYLRINYNINMWDMSNLMAVAGTTTPLIYEPYGYKVPAVVNGKNLFDGELLQGYYTDSTMSTLTATTSNYRTIKIYLKKGNYTLSSSINLLIIRFITSQVYQSNPQGMNTTNNFTFEVENDGYISLAFRNENNETWDNSTNLQIEIGNIATDYETYIEPTTTNIYLDNPIRTVGDEVEYIDYSEQKQHRVRKNLYSSTTEWYLNNTDNPNAKNNSSTIRIKTDIIEIDNNKSNVVMSGLPNILNILTYRFYDANKNSLGGNVDGNIPANALYVSVLCGGTNLSESTKTVIKNSLIQLEYENVTDYEPYIENTEVDVTLPAIPTLDGTNTLSVDTTVQPSNVYIKSRHESSYETAMREDYEEQLSDIESALQEV